MTRKETIQAGSIQFTAARAFPFGSEFAVLSKLEAPGAWKVAFIFGGKGEAEVGAGEGNLIGRRFVVIHECKKIDQRYACLGVPVERIDDEASKIEEDVVATLSRTARVTAAAPSPRPSVAA